MMYKFYLKGKIWQPIVFLFIIVRLYGNYIFQELTKILVVSSLLFPVSFFAQMILFPNIVSCFYLNSNDVIQVKNLHIWYSPTSLLWRRDPGSKTGGVKILLSWKRIKLNHRRQNCLHWLISTIGQLLALYTNVWSMISPTLTSFFISEKTIWFEL